MYDITKIDELVHGSLGSIRVTKKKQIEMKVSQEDRSKIVHTTWLVKYCKKVGANLFCLTCEVSQETKLSSNEMKNILLDTTDCWIVLD